MKIIKHPSSGSLYIFSEDKIIECFYNSFSQQVVAKEISMEAKHSDWLKEQIQLLKN